MVSRVSHPGRPIVLIDLGPGLGTRHRYDLMARTLDRALTEHRSKADREDVHLEQPAR